MQFYNPDFSGGANEENLAEARKNYMKFGTASLKYVKNVRAPLPDESS